MKDTALEHSTETAITQLVALQDIDREVREKTDLLDSWRNEVAELTARLAEQRDACHRLQAELESVETQRRELEARLAAEETKMKDRRMRLNRVRNEKELSALRREIEVGKEANQLLEDEVLGVLEAAEASAARAAEAQQALTELEAVISANAGERTARISGLEAELQRDGTRREEMARTIEPGLLRKYEQIFARRGGTAVVEARNGTCQGCHMHVPPQLYNELQRTQDVRQCPNCHRILFWRAERLDETARPG
jgi:predicted  nucleic acid-binding Zn-ribbon protein